MNYYRSFADYAKIMTNEENEKALTMLKKVFPMAILNI